MGRINRSDNYARERRQMVMRTQDMQRQNEENLQVQSGLELNINEEKNEDKKENNVTQVTEKINDNDFNPEEATTRLKSKQNDKEFTMVDINGVPMEYGLEELPLGNSGQIKLPVGTLVSKLKPNPNNPEYIHVIAWHNKRYRDGYIHESALEDEYKGNTENDVKVFIDDAWHIVHRAELLISKKAYDNKEIDHLREILASVTYDLLLIERGQISITPGILKLVKQQEEESLKINLQDKPGTMQRITKSIFNIIDPKLSNGQNLSETALFIPLTDTWFEDDEKLKKHYEAVIKNDKILSGIQSDTGEGIEREDGLKAWFSELKLLKEIVKGTTKEKSPEGLWLEAITPETEQRTKRIFLLGGKAWKQMANKESKYSSYVSVETSFGPIQANQIQLLLMHELNVNTNSSGLSLLGEDSHIDPADTKAAWETVNKSGFSTISNDHELLDDLFQSHGGRALILLYGYLQKIKAQKK